MAARKTETAPAAAVPAQPVDVATPVALPPALRERLLIIDDFLPADLAASMRADIDAHFAAPQRHRAESHQVWNYWFVEGLYAYLRTTPQKIIAPASVEAFQRRLTDWSVSTLGLGSVTSPYLSLYVGGCRQGLHNDSGGGRFGFVYSLTRNQRATVGGETLVFNEGDPFRDNRATPSAGRGFYASVPPLFNRLVIFDDRLPHAVERVDGSMDPVEGRFVLHGHISETGPLVTGALAFNVARDVAGEVVAAFGAAAGSWLNGYHGPLTVVVEIEPTGAVGEARLLMDRVVGPSAQDTVWPQLLEELLKRFAAARFPAADGPTRLVVPVTFGVLPGR